MQATLTWFDTHILAIAIRHTVVCRRPRKPEKTGHRTQMCYVRGYVLFTRTMI